MKSWKKIQFVVLSAIALGASACVLRISSTERQSVVISGPGAVDPGESKDAYIKIAKLIAEDGEFDRIELTLPANTLVNVSTNLDSAHTFPDTNDNQVIIAARVVSTSAAGAEGFIRSVSHFAHHHVLSVNASPAIYMCDISKINDRVTRIKGTCLDEVSVRIPRDSKTEVLVNGAVIH